MVVFIFIVASLNWLVGIINSFTDHPAVAAKCYALATLILVGHMWADKYLR